MNIHHLELFYFRRETRRHWSCGAQYPLRNPTTCRERADRKLEESPGRRVGTKLFQRRPFALSPAGVELFEFIKPFFDNIEIVSAKLRQKGRRNCA